VQQTSVKKKQLVSLKYCRSIENRSSFDAIRSVLKGLRLLLSNGTVKGKENAAWAIANISVASENQVPSMRSGVVEGLNSYYYHQLQVQQTSVKKKQLVLLQILPVHLRIMFLRCKSGVVEGSETLIVKWNNEWPKRHAARAIANISLSSENQYSFDAKWCSGRTQLLIIITKCKCNRQG